MGETRTFRTSASFGKHTVIARLLQEGLDVYMNLVDNQGIDCVVRKGVKTHCDVRIRAKSRDCLPIDAARFSPMAIKPRPNYYFIFYSEQTDKTWILSSEKLINLTSKNKKGKHIGKYGMSFTGTKEGRAYPLERYKKYEDAFDLLK